MSLLLDALSRASQDKAAAAAAQATPAKPDGPAESLPLLTHDLPEPHPGGSPAAQALPVLELSLSNDALTPARPAVGTTDAWHTESSAATPQKTLLEPFVSTPPRTASPAMESPSEPGPASAATAAASPAVGKPPSRDASRDAPRVAQDIVRAKASAPRVKPPLRLVVLGGLAVLLAAGLGSVLLGWWGEPGKWIESSGLAGSTTVVAPTGATRVEPVAIAPASVEPPALPTSAALPAPALPTPPAVVQAPVAQTTPTKAPTRTAGVPAPAPAVPAPRQAEAPAPSRSAAPAKTGQALIQSRVAGPSTLELAYAALTQGRFPAAAQAYGQALLANPQERDALLGLAYIAHQQGHADEARDYYQRVLRQEPGNVIARSGLLALSTADDPQVAASRLRDVAEQNPDSAAAQVTLGHAMVREGRLAEAQQAFFRAHSLEPGVAQHAFNLAVALDRLRKYGPARQYYERALALSAQSGGERVSGVPQAVVQTRLEQLRAANVANPLGAAHE